MSVAKEQETTDFLLRSKKQQCAFKSVFKKNIFKNKQFKKETPPKKT